MSLLTHVPRTLIFSLLLSAGMNTAQAERLAVPTPKSEGQDEVTAPSNAHAPLHAEVEWRGKTIQVHSTVIDGQRDIELRDDRGRSLVNLKIPRSALSMVDQLQIVAVEREVRGGSSILDVRLEGRSLGGTIVAYQSIYRYEGRGTSIAILWSGRVSETETGDVFRVEDLNGDGKDELVLYAQTSLVGYCGRDDAPLYPRVWDSKSKSFRVVSLLPPLPPGTRRLNVQPEAPTRRWSSAAELRSVSSNAGRAIQRSYGRAPSSLSDEDPTTFWSTNAPGAGVGSFITAQINLAAGLAGFAYTLPEDTGLAPSRVLLTTPVGHYEIPLPQGQRSGYVELPEVIETHCATLSILEVRPRARGAGLAELHFYTGIDTGDLDASLEQRIFQPYREAKDIIERNRLAQLMRVNDARVVEGAMVMLPTLEPGQQPPVVEALMSTPLGQAALYEQLANSKLSSSSIAAIGRSLRRGDGGGIEALYDILEETRDEGTREELIRVVSRTVTSQDALRLLPLIDKASGPSRGDLAFGLGQAQFVDIDALLLALNGRPSDDLVLLRAVSRIARRQAGRQPARLSEEAIAKLSAAMNNDNGTVARVAYQLAGVLGVSALRPRLLQAFEEDPHGHIRLAALKGLATYDLYFAKDTGNTVLLIDALESEDPSIRIAAAQLLRDRMLDELEINFILSKLREEIWTESSRSLVVALIRQGRSDVDLRTAEVITHLDPSLLRTAFVTWQSRQTPPPLLALERLFDRARPNETNLISWTRAMARIETEEAAQVLRGHFEDERVPLRVRAAMLEGMGRQRMKSNLPTILDQLRTSGSIDLRRAAARSLAWFEQVPEARAGLEDAADRETNETVLDSVRASLRALDAAQKTREILLQD